MNAVHSYLLQTLTDNVYQPAMDDDWPVQLDRQGLYPMPEVDDSCDVMRNSSVWPARIVHVMESTLLVTLYTVVKQ